MNHQFRLYGIKYTCIQNYRNHFHDGKFVRAFDSHHVYFLLFFTITLLSLSIAFHFFFNEIKHNHVDNILCIIFGAMTTFGIPVPLHKYYQKNASRFIVSFQLLSAFWLLSIYNSIFFNNMLHPKYSSRIN